MGTTKPPRARGGAAPPSHLPDIRPQDLKSPYLLMFEKRKLENVVTYKLPAGEAEGEALIYVRKRMYLAQSKREAKAAQVEMFPGFNAKRQKVGLRDSEQE